MTKKKQSKKQQSNNEKVLEASNPITSWKILTRVIILLVIFCRWYYSVVTTIWNGWWIILSDALAWASIILVSSMIMIWSLSLLTIDIQKVEWWIVDLVNAVVLLLIVAVVYFTHEFSWVVFLQLLAIVFFHIWIAVFLRIKENYFKTRLDTSIWWIAEVWIVSFWIIVSIIVTLFLWIKIVDAPLECDALYDNLQKASYSSILPVKDASQNILAISQQNLWDFAEKLWSSIPKNSESSFATMLKTSVIDQVLEDKELVRESFCEMIAKLLDNRVTNNVWSLSVYIILFLLLSPIMTLLFRVVSIIVWIVLKILKFFHVYKRKKKMKQIKKLV